MAGIFEYARDESRWKQVAKPEWGSSKFGHTHPDFSNSGLHALLAETYAALGKFDGITRLDIYQELDKVSSYLHGVEHSIVHYGTSTGFLGERMFSQGPSYLSAAILYENLVIEANVEARRRNPAIELPQIVPFTRPKEPFHASTQLEWSNAPGSRTSIVRQGMYISFLMERPQQQLALRYGFRPSDSQPGIDLKPLLKPDYGVSPIQPKKLLHPPPATAIRLIQDVWRLSKRNADVVLLIDTSASMEGDKIRGAEDAAKAFIELLSPGDSLSAVIFGADVEWMARDLRMDHQGKEEAKRSIDHLIPDGDTSLYQAVSEGYQFLEQRGPGRTRALIVLSDGKDTKRTPSLSDLIGRFKSGKGGSIFVFTIGYGADADPETLEEISKQTKAKYYKGSVDSIRKVFAELATFF